MLQWLGSLFGRSTPRTETWPEALRRYTSLRRTLPRNMPLGGVRFAVFDSETSGLDMQKNRLLSLAGIALVGSELRMDDSFEVVIRQDDVGGAAAATVHGLVPRDLSEGRPEDEAAADFLAWAADGVLVAHHAAFDVRMLQKAISAHSGARVWNPVLDTVRLVERFEHGPLPSADQVRSSRSLDAVLERYGVQVFDRHTAAGDALATGVLLQILLKRAEARGIRTLGALL